MRGSAEKRPFDVRVDFAHVGVEGCGEGDGGCVGAAAAEGGHVVVFGDALEASDDGDLAVLDGAGDALGDHADDLGGAEVAVGLDARLGARVGAGFDAEFVDGHGQQGHGDAFAGGQEDVHLTHGRVVGECCGRVEEVIRRVAHRRYDDDDAVSRVVRVHVRWATRFMASVSATEEPPYFCTISATGPSFLSVRAGLHAFGQHTPPCQSYGARAITLGTSAI